MNDRKKQAPSWIGVLLSAVVTTLFCGSVQAGWQRDMVMGTGGGNNQPAPSYNPGPSADQIAAQQAAQAAAQQAAKREAERQARLKTAHRTNDQGIASFNRRDWASAVADFQRALENAPGDRTIRSNLAKAQEQLNEQRREEQRTVADTAAATDMKAAISQITTSIPDRSANFPQPSGGGLTFVPADDPDHAVTNGDFGTKNSKPNLVVGDRNAGNVGPNTKAIDQATSAAHTEKSVVAQPGGVTAEDASTKLGLGFDTGQQKSGSVSEVTVATPTSEAEMPKITPAMQKDPIVQQDLQNYNKWNPQLQKAREEVKQAQAAADNAKDPGAKAAANATLIAAKGKSDGLEIAVQSAKAEIADRKIHIEKFAVSGQASANQSQASAAAAGAPAGAAPAN